MLDAIPLPIAHILLSLLSLAISIIITVIIFWIYRYTALAKIVLPGQDEANRAEDIFNEIHRRLILEKEELQDKEYHLHAKLGHAILLRNALTIIAVAIIFLTVFSSVHHLTSIL